MITKTEILNMALGHVGNKPITDYATDPTSPAQYGRLFYPTALGEMLESQEWSFATKRVSLTSQLLNVPLFGFDVAFQLPSDLVLIVGTDPETAEWKVEGNTLVTNESSIGLIYVYNSLDTQHYNSKFVAALTLLLGAYLAMPITRSKELAAQLYALYERKKVDSQNADSNQASRPIEALDALIVVRR